MIHPRIECAMMRAYAEGFALTMRFASQGRSEYADRLLAVMRRGFGGHAVERKGAQP